MRPLSPLVLSIATAVPLAGCALDDDFITGERAQEIVGGALTSAYEAVPLLYSEFADGSASLCSGTLISERVVLTAAHCLEFNPPPTRHLVYFGSDITIENDPDHLATIPVAEYAFHPNWNINDLEGGHDIGLVLMAQPGPVAPMGVNREALAGRNGDQVHLVGWGRTTGNGNDYGKKREVMSSLQAHNSLLMRYGSATANTCQGDSGGPNFMVQNGAEVVAGITSYGNVGCDQYGVGTNVANFAAGYIDPFIVQKDPSGSCLADGGCNTSCGAVDPDCPADGTAPDGDDVGDGDGGDEDGGGNTGGGTRGARPVTGGCSAGGGMPTGGAALLLLGLAGLWRRRR
jgi:MYXO-CTERM domain-containing protein